MSSEKRYLTKSRFKVGYECPTKLAFLDDKSIGNNNVENAFLEALAEGGFQVGELAKIYIPGGTEITTTNKEDAYAETINLLKNEKVTIYEASIKVDNLFVKIDVLRKMGNSIELIEVKAKSFNGTEENPFYNKTSLKKGKPKLSTEWEPYLFDIAFQTYVFKKALPKYSVTSSLMLADKNAVASVDGLNQGFLLARDQNGRNKVVVHPSVNSETCGTHLLKKISVDDEVAIALSHVFDDGFSFEQKVNQLSDICLGKITPEPVVGGKCKSCEFRISDEKKSNGLKSGFDICWKQSAKFSNSDLQKPHVFEIWNFRKSGKLIEDKKYFISQLELEDVGPTPGEEGLSNSERQWLQIEKSKNNDLSPFIDLSGLRREMSLWKYPLHFIDFETTMSAIPFNAGRRPYEQVAFQFSHHTVGKDGKITHQTEYINKCRGAFPNFEFLRALKGALANDEGTVFRYATHENTVLNQIRGQIQATEGISDKDELVKFIESITKSTDDSVEKWTGHRNMIDMCDLVKRYFYHPLTKGSNSIKKVLPAILKESKFLQNKYSNPVYGSDNLKSLNFKNWKWIDFDSNGDVVDPYRKLPPIFSDIDLETMDSLITEGSIADGGAAMTAYARSQFTEMTQEEFDRVSSALLKYCELDTFAMVLIFEYWNHEIQQSIKKVA